MSAPRRIDGVEEGESVEKADYTAVTLADEKGDDI
jgi:hypothetical protein